MGKGAGIRTQKKIYYECKDTTSYLDSSFNDGHLWYSGKVENNFCNGKWTWFDTNGSKLLEIVYDNNVIKERTSYEENYKETYEYKNDSVFYLKRFNLKDILLSEGVMQNEYMTGQWIFHDTITMEKTIANYLPKTQLDSTVIENNETGEIVTTFLPSNGILNGQWKKYNKQGEIIESRNYVMGQVK